MSATRSSSLQALKQLSSHSHQVRHLHMTGPATFPSSVRASERNVRATDTFKSLRAAESMKRGLPTIASKDESNPMGQASRTMATTHTPVRPQPAKTTGFQKSTREINTSRSLRSVKDSSTIDFAFLPREPESAPVDSANMRVPILPDNYAFARAGAHANPAPSYDQASTLMRAQVVTAAGEGTHVSAPSAMSEVHDNNSAGIDYSALAEAMESAAFAVGEKAKESQGAVRVLWNGVVEDIFGPRRALA